MTSKITPKRIGRFFHVFTTEGITGVSKRTSHHMSEVRTSEYEIKINLFDLHENCNEIKDYEEILFKKETEPLVSIIIPAYNQFSYTYNCLKSIKNHTEKEIAYEVIIADDRSPDLIVKGKYILFLSNDTQVQENWLQPLVELIEKDDTIGAVGPKLVLKNGKLQEAGGIVWKGASAWSYGKNCHPALPEFNYVKEVDYISGAALMVKRAIWEKLGGFDDFFSPAYYEDIDLCFSIRKLGYKVIYQPASVVVHFEGITNGTNISEGQKQHQAINKKRFYAKWKDTLEKEHYPNGENVFLARDRSFNKKTILVIDHYVPFFDKDAGSRSVFQYLKLFTSLGFNIKFIDDSFHRVEPYTAVIEQMGIEVLYGLYYLRNWKSWLKKNGQYIDYVFLNRPPIFLKYIDAIKKYTKAKVFYYGHDLYFLREQRGYEITGDNALLKSANKWKKTELGLMTKADVVYYPSQVEWDEVKRQNPSINIKTIPVYLYEDQPKNDKNITQTKNIMFVGGFGHAPNVDGILWYAKEIYPLILEKHPEIKTYILGSNPPEEILQLNSENSIVTGFVTDEQLNDFYNTCRLVIVPLRYGAGVKGKVIEAMYHQMPIVTTSIGAEGIKGAAQCMSIKDDPSAFAEEVMRVYNDFELLSEMSLKGIDLINETFTFAAVRKIILEDFKPLP